MNFVNKTKSATAPNETLGNTIPQMTEQEANTILTTRQRHYLDEMEIRGGEDAAESQQNRRR